MRLAQNCFSLRLDHFGKEDLCISYSDHPWRHWLLLQLFNFAITLLLLANRRVAAIVSACTLSSASFQPLEWEDYELGGQVETWPLLFKGDGMTADNEENLVWRLGFDAVPPLSWGYPGVPLCKPHVCMEMVDNGPPKYCKQMGYN